MRKDVYIVDREKLIGCGDKHYQVMCKMDYGLYHLFPRKVMTLSEATRICEENDFEVVKTGTAFECLNTESNFT